MKMAYFVLAAAGIIGVLSAGAILFGFLYALYIKYWLGDRRKLSEIFWSL
jgi:hypothetical protein